MSRLDEQAPPAIALGQIFVRNLAMCFDAYLNPRQQIGRPVFSRTV